MKNVLSFKVALKKYTLNSDNINMFSIRTYSPLYVI